MSFFNTVHIATKEDCEAPWAGGAKGKYFRCALCSHKFIEGDEFIIIYTNDMSKAWGNPTLCTKCHGPTIEDSRAKWAARHAEWNKQEFWWFKRHMGD